MLGISEVSNATYMSTIFEIDKIEKYFFTKIAVITMKKTSRLAFKVYYLIFEVKIDT